MYTKLIQEKKLSSGARVLATNFPAHDLVSFVGSVLGGARMAGSSEFAKIHADMLLDGTKTRSKQEIQEFLDSVGANLSFSASSDRVIFSGSVLEKHFDKLLTLIAEVLTEPIFPAKELAILKKREQGALLLEARDTRTQASIALSRMLFPHKHPNCSDTTDESKVVLEKITRSALLDYHKKIIDNSSLVLSVAGDLEPKNIFATIERRFKKVPVNKITLPTFDASATTEAQTVMLPIPHKSSIDYMIGIATGITDSDADYAPLLLGVRVLGNASGFTGRLMETVREKEGLTYGVYSYLSGFTAHIDGCFATWATFAPELFEKGKAGVVREIKKIVEKGVTDDEAKKHSELYDASFRVRLSNSGALARAAHDVIVSGKSISHLDNFPKKMLSVSASEVNRVIKKYIQLDKLSSSAAGPVDVIG